MRRSEFLSFLLDCFQFKILCTLSRNSEVVNLFPYIIYTNFLSVCMHAKSLQSCPTLCDLVDCRPPGSSVHGILQARILEWVAMPSSRGLSWPRDQICVSLPLLYWTEGTCIDKRNLAKSVYQNSCLGPSDSA